MPWQAKCTQVCLSRAGRTDVVVASFPLNVVIALGKCLVMTSTSSFVPGSGAYPGVSGCEMTSTEGILAGVLGRDRASLRIDNEGV